MKKIKVGLLVPLQGPMGVWGPTSIKSAILAAAEVNHMGGITGQELDLIIRDAAWGEDQAAQAARRLVHEDGVSVVVAMVGSNARRAMAWASPAWNRAVMWAWVKSRVLASTSSGMAATDRVML